MASFKVSKKPFPLNRMKNPVNVGVRNPPPLKRMSRASSVIGQLHLLIHQHVCHMYFPALLFSLTLVAAG